MISHKIKKISGKLHKISFHRDDNLVYEAFTKLPFFNKQKKINRIKQAIQQNPLNQIKIPEQTKPATSNFWNHLILRLKNALGKGMWHIAVSDESIENVIKNQKISNFQILPNPKIKNFGKTSYIADPCFFFDQSQQEETILLEFHQLGQKGEIWQFFPKTQTYEPIIQENFHLSYPTILTHQGETYLLPECSENGVQLIYKKQNGQWKKFKEIKEINGAVDPTILEHDGKFWLFATDKKFPNEMLNIFHTQDPINDTWHAHAQNPVKFNICSSRPAGSFIKTKDGKIIRPAQDSLSTYGHQIRFFELQTLTTSKFQETEIAQMKSPSLTHKEGFHTINNLKNKTIFDAKKL